MQVAALQEKVWYKISNVAILKKFYKNKPKLASQL